MHGVAKSTFVINRQWLITTYSSLYSRQTHRTTCSRQSTTEATTTGIRAIVECRRLYRVLFIGHSANRTLPRAALDKVLRSVKSLFTECGTLGTQKHSANTALPSDEHSTKMALGKGPLVAVYGWRPSAFAEGRSPALGKAYSLPSVNYLTLGKESLYRVFSVGTRQSIFLFFYFSNQTFCDVFLHYIDLHIPFWDNYNSVFNS
jgi:hypothetical protein